MVLSGNPVPTFYLVHSHCLRIFQGACPESNIHLRYVIVSAVPVRATGLHHHCLSDLDAAALVAKFNPDVSDNLKRSLESSDCFRGLIRSMQELPAELIQAFLLQCRLDLALALTAYGIHNLFVEMLRRDIVRTRIASCIAAAALLRHSMRQELFTEEIIPLEEKIQATLIQLAGKEYLQDFRKELSSPEAFEFIIPKDQTQQLALLVDDIGVKNIGDA
jgi:hypothetical protein